MVISSDGGHLSIIVSPALHQAIDQPKWLFCHIGQYGSKTGSLGWNSIVITPEATYQDRHRSQTVLASFRICPPLASPRREIIMVGKLPDSTPVTKCG